MKIITRYFDQIYLFGFAVLIVASIIWLGEMAGVISYSWDWLSVALMSFFLMVIIPLWLIDVFTRNKYEK
jgi:hypothetical protein